MRERNSQTSPSRDRLRSARALKGRALKRTRYWAVKGTRPASSPASASTSAAAGWLPVPAAVSHSRAMAPVSGRPRNRARGPGTLAGTVNLSVLPPPV